MAEESKPERAAAVDWALFSVGAIVSALFMPAFIFLVAFGPALGLGDVLAPGAVRSWLANPLVKLFWIVVGIGTIYHGLHRLKFVLYDYGGARHRAVTDAFAYIIVAIGAILILYLVLAT